MAADVEMALRSYAIDLLQLAQELGVGPIDVYADPDGVGFITGCAWPKEGGETPVASFSEFPGEEGGDSDE
jgi:hypothetical protein